MKTEELLLKAEYWKGFMDGQIATLDEWIGFEKMSKEEKLSWATRNLFKTL